MDANPCHKKNYKVIKNIATWMNMFPSKNGISRDLGPAAIILGLTNPYYNKLRITFESYS